MLKAVYGGSFDPVTLGHLDIIKRASAMVDELVVAVLENPNKQSLFSTEERKYHLEIVTESLDNVTIASFQGLLVDFARSVSANVAIRGLRNAIDFASEFQMHLINRQLNDNVETIFLAANEKHLALSSTNVKEVAIFGGDISSMVPEQISGFVKEKYKK